MSLSFEGSTESRGFYTPALLLSVMLPRSSSWRSSENTPCIQTFQNTPYPKVGEEWSTNCKASRESNFVTSRVS
jgi:hypothetical protein